MATRRALQLGGWALIALALLTLGTFIATDGVRHPGRGPTVASECGLRYARARTYTDTLIADRVDVGNRYDRLLCEDYRLNRRGKFPGGPHADR